MVSYIKEDAKKFLTERFGWQPYLKSILNLASRNFMRAIGCPRGLAMMLEEFSFLSNPY